MIFFFKIAFEVFNGILLTAYQEVYFVVDELKLPAHFLVHVMDFIHRPDHPMDSLKVRQVFVKGVFQFALFLVIQRRSLIPDDLFLQEVFLAAVGYQEGSRLF